jgi:beta-barrel assembly-enhancing protease
MRLCGAAWVALIGLALTIAATGPVGAQSRQPGERPAPETVEAGLWAEADKAELVSRRSAEHVQDPELNEYMRDVTCRVAPEFCSDIRVYVMERPIFNATASPNGWVEVWTGLLLTASNEAELAAVIGHEIGHFEENHSVEALQAAKRRQAAAMALSIGVAVAGAVAIGNTSDPNLARTISDVTGAVIDLTYYSAVAMHFAYSRDNEEQADLIGLKRLSAAGYDPAAAADLWRALVDQTRMSEFRSIRESGARISVFNTHPATADRIDAIDRFAKAQNASGSTELGRERYRAAIRPHLLRWLRRDLQRRDWTMTIATVDRLAKAKEDLGVLEYIRGEAYRRRNKADDPQRAFEAYRAASGHPDAPPEAFRELGDLARKQGDPEITQAAYRRYLSVTPVPQDAWLVRETLEGMK